MADLPMVVDNLVLRRLTIDDAQDLFEIYSDPATARFQFWGPWDLEQVRNYLFSQLEIQMGDPGVPLVVCVILSSPQKLIGDCAITIQSIEDKQAEIGFSFNQSFTGQGHATKAVHAVLGFAFSELQMHRVVAATNVRNEPSWRLMERIGMRREAHFLHDSFAKGEWIDDYVYAMLDEEWRQQ